MSMAGGLEYEFSDDPEPEELKRRILKREAPGLSVQKRNQHY